MVIIYGRINLAIHLQWRHSSLHVSFIPLLLISPISFIVLFHSWLQIMSIDHDKCILLVSSWLALLCMTHCLFMDCSCIGGDWSQSCRDSFPSKPHPFHSQFAKANCTVDISHFPILFLFSSFLFSYLIMLIGIDWVDENPFFFIFPTGVWYSSCSLLPTHIHFFSSSW